MAYEKTDWEDNLTPVDAEHMNKIEDGIADAQTAAEAAQSTADSAQTAAEAAQSTADSAQTAAEAAQSTADSAQTAAEAAQSTADSANSAVESEAAERKNADDDLQEQITTNAGLMYPVGSIYLSVIDVSPETYYGGTWQKIEDCFLLAAGSSHAAGETGGSETVTLTASQVPELTGTAASAGAHTHPTYYVTDNTTGGNARRLGNADAYDGNSNSTVSAGAHTHSVTVNSSGGGSHNNMPPYLTVYMWQRIA